MRSDALVAPSHPGGDPCETAATTSTSSRGASMRCMQGSGALSYPEADTIGRLVEIWRYPVKSMAGERLASAEADWHGLVGDRRWAFIRPGLERSDFPWLTIRENPVLWRYVPRIVESARAGRTATLVQTPEGDELEVADPRLAARLGTGARVIKQNRGVFDTAPLSLISLPTVSAVCELAGVGADVRRFRPNLVVEPLDGRPYAEDEWVGRTLRIAGLRLRIDQCDPRCVIVNVHPDSGSREPKVLRTIAQQRETFAGVYATTVAP